MICLVVVALAARHAEGVVVHSEAHLSFNFTNMKNELTDLCGSCLLQNVFMNTFREIKVDLVVIALAARHAECVIVHGKALKRVIECPEQLHLSRDRKSYV